MTEEEQFLMTSTKKTKKKPRERILRDGKWFTKRGAELTRNLNTQTESEHMSVIRSALRQSSRFWKPLQACLEAASRPYEGTCKRTKKEYQCSKCSKWFVRAKVEVNHIVECGTLKNYQDVVGFLERLFCEDVNGFEVVCKPCHLVITKGNKVA